MNTKEITIRGWGDHQPAPEPEPEWKPGTVAVATITYDDGVQHDVRVARTDMNRGVVMWAELENGTGHGVWHTDEHVTDVRPLVVIDPAAVDVNALAKVIRDAVKMNPTIWKHAALQALTHLGIEATR